MLNKTRRALCHTLGAISLCREIFHGKGILSSLITRHTNTCWSRSVCWTKTWKKTVYQQIMGNVVVTFGVGKLGMCWRRTHRTTSSPPSGRVSSDRSVKELIQTKLYYGGMCPGYKMISSSLATIFTRRRTINLHIMSLVICNEYPALSIHRDAARMTKVKVHARGIDAVPPLTEKRTFIGRKP